MSAEIAWCLAALVGIGPGLGIWIYVLSSRLTKLEAEVRFLRMDVDTSPRGCWEAIPPTHRYCDGGIIFTPEESEE